MIIHDVEQGTEAWLMLRSGIPTASEFDKILTKSGKRSTSAEGYMHTLLGERMMQHPSFNFMSDWMSRGKELEARAVSKYEFLKDVDTFPIGFITDDLKKWGASPDRGINPKAGLEIKCPKDSTHVGYLLGGSSVLDAYRPQAMGQLWIAEWDYIDMFSFHPEMPEALIRTERDEPYIKLLEEAVLEFSDKLEAKARELADKGWLAADRVKADPFSNEVHEAFAVWNAK